MNTERNTEGMNNPDAKQTQITYNFYDPFNTNQLHTNPDILLFFYWLTLVVTWTI